MSSYLPASHHLGRMTEINGFKASQTNNGLSYFSKHHTAFKKHSQNFPLFWVNDQLLWPGNLQSFTKRSYALAWRLSRTFELWSVANLLSSLGRDKHPA